MKAGSQRRAGAPVRKKAKAQTVAPPGSGAAGKSEKLGPMRDLPHEAVIADKLIKDIVTGVYAPGQWIREQEIAERFGVSRTPVRNAFRHVARAGFIVVRPWRGAQVLELSADDTRYVLDVLEALYGVAMRIAAETLPEKYFPEADALLELSERAAERNDLNARIALSFELGRKLARWSASALTYELLVRVGNLAFWQHRFFDFDVRALIAQSIVMHRELVAAVKGRKADVADRTAREIIALTRSFLIPRIRLAEMEAARATRAPGRKRGS